MKLHLFGDSVFAGAVTDISEDPSDELRELRTPASIINLTAGRDLARLAGDAGFPVGVDEAEEDIAQQVRTGRIASSDAIAFLDVGDHAMDTSRHEADWLRLRKAATSTAPVRLVMCSGFDNGALGQRHLQHEANIDGRSANDAVRAAALAEGDFAGRATFLDVATPLKRLHAALSGRFGLTPYYRDGVHLTIWGQILLSLLMLRELGVPTRGAGRLAALVRANRRRLGVVTALEALEVVLACFSAAELRAPALDLDLFVARVRSKGQAIKRHLARPLDPAPPQVPKGAVARLLARAKQLEQSGEPAEALSAYRSAAAADPDFPDAYRGWIRTAVTCDRPEDVIEAGRVLLPMAPNEGKNYVWMAESILKMDSEPELVAWLDDLAEVHAPPGAHHAMALLIGARGDPDRAKVWFRRVTPEAGRALGNHALEELDFYIEALGAEGADEPDRGERLVQLHLEAGRPAEVRSVIEQATQPSAQLQLTRAMLDAEAGELASALARLEAAAAIGPNHAVELALKRTRRAMTFGDRRRRPFPQTREGSPLTVMISPTNRERLLGWFFLRRFTQADRGDMVRSQLFRADSRDAGWVFPAYCGVGDRLTPRGREGPDGYFLFDIIPPEVIAAVRSGRGTLLIDHGLEGLFSAYPEADAVKIGAFMDYAQKMDLPVERMILLDSNLKSPGELRLAGAAGLKVVEDRYLWLELAGVFRRLRRETAGVDERLIEAKAAMESGKPRTKAFLSYNHAPRAHRSVLVGFLLERDLLERGFVSFHGPDYLRDRNRPFEDEEWIARTMVQIQDFAGLLGRPEQTLRQLLAKSPMTVDVDYAGTGRTAKALAYGANEAWPYLASWFSVVTDTVFSDGRSSHVTEKIIKPVANLHPFVYLGEPFALAELARRGFQTFSPFIDESYDAITDPVERMTAVLKETERLARLSPDQLGELYRACWPRLEHNYAHLIDSAPWEAERILGRIEQAMAAMR